MEKIAIILDTNVFGDPKNYDFEKGISNYIFSALKECSNIEVFVPNIVFEELKKHIRENIEKDRSNMECRYLKNKIDFEQIIEEMTENLKKFVENNKLKILDCEKYLNITDVNQWYFTRQKPFQESKPKEFPDAMIISAVSNFLKKEKYDEKYIVSGDKGFVEAIQREADDVTVLKELNEVTKEIFGFDENVYKKVQDFIYSEKILIDTDLFEFESSDFNDIIDIDEVVDTNLNVIEILSDDSKSTLVYMRYDSTLSGNIFVLDPYESCFDDEDNEYIYPIYRATDTLKLRDIRVYLDIIKDESGKYSSYEIIDKPVIDITNYLDEMEYYNEE